MTPTRFASYGRLSTTDKQDPALSFPSQLKACERKVSELGGEITATFEDQESGAKQDRPGWAALTAEARERDTRRFDAVVIYSTSRLARDRLYAALFERELQKVGVSIHYATGAGDPTTPEGKVFIGMQQLWDEFERNKLARETKRGMREGTEQGYRMGGRAPYGYRRDAHALPEGHRGDTSKQRVKLTPEPDEAVVVARDFPSARRPWLQLQGHCRPPEPSRWATAALPCGSKPQPSRSLGSEHDPLDAQEPCLHRPDGLEPPGLRHRTPERRRATPTSTRGMGRLPRLAPAPRLRRDLPALPRTLPDPAPPTAHQRHATSRNYLFAGMAHCTTDHQPLSMQGKARKGHHYYACSYGATYGDTAAADVHAGQKWIYLREDALLPLVEQFFAQRIFGPMRLEKLARQLHTHDRERKRNGQLLATRLRQQISEADRKIKVQVQALEDGIEPEIVTARITELRADRQAAQDALDELTPAEIEAEDDYLTQRLARIPDLARSPHDATPEIKRQTFQAFDLRIEFDKAQRRIEISATITEAVAQAFENTKALQTEGLQVTTTDIAGAGFEPATFGL